MCVKRTCKDVASYLPHSSLSAPFEVEHHPGGAGLNPPPQDPPCKGPGHNHIVMEIETCLVSAPIHFPQIITGNLYL